MSSSREARGRANACAGRRGSLLGLLLILGLSSDYVWSEPSSDPEFTEPLQLEYLPPSFYDFSQEELDLEPKKGIWINSTNWIMQQQDIQSDRVENLGDWLDRVLSGEAVRTPYNESYLRLGLATRWEKSNWISLEPEARFRLDLPTVEEKFRLVVENAPDELIPLREQNEDRLLTDSERSDTETTGALRYLTLLTERGSLSNDLGVRFGWPLNPFVRTQLQAAWHLDETWRMDVEQRFFYFHTDGWGERSEVIFSRYFSPEYHLSLRTDLQWVDQETRFEWSQIGYLNQFIDNRNQITYRGGVAGESQPNWRPISYFFDAAWRIRLHDDWLFGEIIPAVEFPREDDFRENPSITLRIEMFFAGDDYIPYEKRFLRD